MKEILLHPTYFPSIETMVQIVKADKIVWEIEDNYQKQTYRNRTYIAHSNGKLLLNIPVKHIRGERQKTKNICVDDSVNWQRQHLKSIKIAYRTSPFFEFYEDEIEDLLLQPVNNLMSYNLLIFDFLKELVEFEIETSSTEKYEHETKDLLDLRYLVDAKKPSSFKQEPYTQVLEEAHGFLPNLSILDLLFNEGPNTLNYLKNQSI